MYIKVSQITAAFDVDGEGFVVVGSEEFLKEKKMIFCFISCQ